MSAVEAPAAAPMYRRFSSAQGEHILVVPYSRIFDLPSSWARGDSSVSDEAERMIEALSLPSAGEASLDDVPLPPVRSLSLNVSSSCNLSCSYCYAGRGSFEGKQVATMPWSVARAAVDRLIDDSKTRDRLTIGFLGGEPFVNRRLIHQVVEYASEKSDRVGAVTQFSVTTNGTLLNEADRAMLRAHGFAVTVSVDGTSDSHQSQRPFYSSADREKSSWDKLRTHVAPLLADPGKAKIGARATVTRSNFDLRGGFDAILDMGFTEVGFSPLRHSATPGQSFTDADWDAYVQAMSEVAAAELSRALNGDEIRLTNFAIAMRQIHRGWAAPFSCGAAGGYFSVGSDGGWYACHRAIGQPEYRMGDNFALDQNARQTFLIARHVHSQTDCKQCWARYLCSGGCHQEQSKRTAASCDFVRAWLTFCLASYCDLSAMRPAWFHQQPA